MESYDTFEYFENMKSDANTISSSFSLRLLV